SSNDNEPEKRWTASSAHAGFAKKLMSINPKVVSRDKCSVVKCSRGWVSSGPIHGAGLFLEQELNRQRHRIIKKIFLLRISRSTIKIVRTKNPGASLLF